MKSNIELYKIAVSYFQGIGPIYTKKLIDQISDIAHLFEYSPSELERIYNVNNDVIKKINRKKALMLAQEQLSFCKEFNYDFLYFNDTNYPYYLKNCPDAPLVIYVKGSCKLENKKMISIVGTRNCSSYGESILNDLIPKFKNLENVVLVSGLAYGVDIHMHRLCIKHNIPNIAVLGHGFDRIYPIQHRLEAQKIIDNGLLISEFPYGAKLNKFNFPKRNRIIAGLTMATIVIESKLRGGSLITAHRAFDYNREVFCYPGNIYQENSKGCNELIKKDIAKPILGFDDLLQQLEWSRNTFWNEHSMTHFELDDEEKMIVKEIKSSDLISFDALISKTSLKIQNLNKLLVQLELKGLIHKIYNNHYQML